MKPKIYNLPKSVYLQVVGSYDGEDDTDFTDVQRDDISWCDVKIFDGDVEYKLVKKKNWIPK